jgi:hypothetical protein
MPSTGGTLLRTITRAAHYFVLALIVGSLFHAVPARADTITVLALDSGTYTSSGFHLSTNKNYTTGISGGTELRSYFVFNLPSFSAPILSAELQLSNPPNGYTSPDAFEIFQLFDVLTPIASLQATNFGATGIFTDLGNGTPYGIRSVSAADDGALVTIPLNISAISAITASGGSTWALGGVLTTLGGATNEFMFGFTGTGTPTRTLVVTVVPEPGTFGSLSLGLLLWAATTCTRSRLRRKK